MQRLLIIVGMYRSGSSALTQALHELGYYPGAQENLRSADEFNSAGYWENSRILRLNDMLTAQFGLGDFSCQCLPLDWESFPASDLLVDHAAALVRSLYRDQVFAGWKDPENHASASILASRLRRGQGRCMLSSAGPRSDIGSLQPK